MNYGFCTQIIVDELRHLGFNSHGTYEAIRDADHPSDDAMRIICQALIPWTEAARFIYERSGGVVSISFSYDFTAATVGIYRPEDKGLWRFTANMDFEDAFMKAIKTILS